eukprot:Amastigsp_a677108_23.p2 type:complete len:134 gc:universal Amastigsp_a677108_23:437-838(+)
MREPRGSEELDHRVRDERLPAWPSRVPVACHGLCLCNVALGPYGCLCACATGRLAVLVLAENLPRFCDDADRRLRRHGPSVASVAALKHRLCTLKTQCAVSTKPPETIEESVQLLVRNLPVADYFVHGPPPDE